LGSTRERSSDRDSSFLMLVNALEFFTDNAAQGVFEGFPIGFILLDIVAEDVVDEGLIVSATCEMNLLAKPVEDVVVEADGDAGFVGAEGSNRAAFALAEVVGGFHGYPFRYCWVSVRSALRAEINRI
jgi:hypothetical protein